ncbi:MAG TPA: hypothetical protein VFT74_11795, partial [Isosphaeraceae bacterium]|nr:hypothetical protein [Isosphaeraceae bacterium]
SLIQMGAHELRPTAEVLAALDALRSLLSDAKAGDLHHRGEPVSPQSVEQWLLSHMPDPLDTLADRLTRYPTIAGSSAVQDDLLNLLANRPVIDLEEAARLIKVPVVEVEDALSNLGESIGLLSGPPPVIFRLEGELLDA